MNSFARHFKLFFLIQVVTGFLLSSCKMATGKVIGPGGPELIQSVPEDLPPDTTEVDAFEKYCSKYEGAAQSYCLNVWKVSRSNRCIECHAANSSLKHASENLEEAFDAVIEGEKINFERPEYSALYTTIKKGHQFWNEGDAESERIASEFLSGINVFTAESASELGIEILPLKTQTLSIPQTLPATRTGAQELQVPLSNLYRGGAGFANSFMKFKIFKVETEDSYRLIDFRIYSPKNLKLTRMDVEINGAKRSNDATFKTAILLLPTQPTLGSPMNITAGVTTSPDMMLLTDQGPGKDQLAFAFSKLEEYTVSGGGTAVVTGPTAAERMKAAKDVIAARCISCHGATLQRGGIRFDADNLGNNITVDAATEATWEAFQFSGTFGTNIKLISKATPTNSPLYRLIKNTNLPAGQGPMPDTLAQADRDKDAQTLLDFVTNLGKP